MTPILIALAVLAQPQPQPQPQPLSAELQPLAFVAGSCWRGTFPGGGRTDTHCFTPFYGGAFLRDRHVVEGAPQPYTGETLYRWDRDSRTIRFDYYASDGSHSDGAALPAANGLVFPEETYRSSDGGGMLIRNSWTRDGDDAYVVLSEAKRGEAWTRLWQMRMERIGPADSLPFPGEGRGPAAQE